MDWTGGRLQRSKKLGLGGGTDARALEKQLEKKKQMAYFAKQKLKRMNGGVRSMPSFAIMDYTEKDERGGHQITAEVRREGKPSSLKRHSSKSNCDTRSIEEKRQALLQRQDWLGIAVARDIASFLPKTNRQDSSAPLRKRTGDDLRAEAGESKKRGSATRAQRTLWTHHRENRDAKRWRQGVRERARKKADAEAAGTISIRIGSNIHGSQRTTTRPPQLAVDGSRMPASSLKANTSSTRSGLFRCSERESEAAASQATNTPNLFEIYENFADEKKEVVEEKQQDDDLGTGYDKASFCSSCASSKAGKRRFLRDNGTRDREEERDTEASSPPYVSVHHVSRCYSPRKKTKASLLSRPSEPHSVSPPPATAGIQRLRQESSGISEYESSRSRASKRMQGHEPSKSNVKRKRQVREKQSRRKNPFKPAHHSPSPSSLAIAPEQESTRTTPATDNTPQTKTSVTGAAAADKEAEAAAASAAENEAWFQFVFNSAAAPPRIHAQPTMLEVERDVMTPQQLLSTSIYSSSSSHSSDSSTSGSCTCVECCISVSASQEALPSSVHVFTARTEFPPNHSSLAAHASSSSEYSASSV